MFWQICNKRYLRLKETCRIAFCKKFSSIVVTALLFEEVFTTFFSIILKHERSCVSILDVYFPNYYYHSFVLALQKLEAFVEIRVQNFRKH